jgi:hypothetical protein
MEAPPRYSVSPYYSFVTVPSRPAVSFSASLRSIIAWLTNRQPTPPKSEIQLEQRIIDLLVEEMAEAETNPTGINLIDKPPIAPRRPRRLTGREDR